jgi:nucleotide-binding universal stress UspA family protein
MELKRILWPTDLSGTAEAALPYVKSLTQKYNTEIHVLYVIEDIAHHKGWYGDFDQSHIRKIRDWEEKTAKARLDKICTNFLEGCPLYIKHIAVGDPAQEILKLIEAEQIDTVVIATRGERSHFGFGSVAEKIVKNAPVPVVTIPVAESETEAEAAGTGSGD